MSEWQPIETAPRDGTIIVLWSERDGIGLGSWWENKYKIWETTPDGMTQHLVRVEDNSRFTGTTGEGIDMWNPIYWMPLPPAPIHPETGEH